MFTNASNGITSFGVPLPMIGMPTQGKYIFVKPRTGLDGNSGLSLYEAVKTLKRALAIATSNQNDTILFFAEGNSESDTTDYQSETLTWDKDLVHLVGVCSPVMYSQRSSISQLSTATGISPLMNITANGCMFLNFSISHFVADATSKRCLQVTGQRNYFKNVAVQGIGNATMDVATACSLVLSGASENVFENCTIGLDTIARTTSTYEVIMQSAATRNSFINCIFPTYSGTAGRFFLSANTSGALGRTTLFENCKFINAIKSSATQMTEAFDVHSSAGGLILLKDCTLLGATDWEANTESTCTYIDGGAPVNNTSGLAVLVEAT